MINGELVDVTEINTNVGKFQRFYLNFTDKDIGLSYSAIIDRHENREILRLNGFIAPKKYYYDRYISNYNYITNNLSKIE